MDSTISTIESRCRQIVAQQLGLEQGTIKPESKLADDLGADSLDEIELAMAIEDEFQMEIPDEEAEQIETFQQIVDYVSKRKAS